jgi:hypothetical protein
MERHRLVAVLAFVVGVAGVLSPLALYAFHEPYQHVSTDIDGRASVPPDASVVEYRDLAREGHSFLDPDPRTMAGPVRSPTRPITERPYVFSPAEWERADLLRTNDHFLHDDRYHPIETESFVATPRHPRHSDTAVFLMPLWGVLAVAGGLSLATDSPRPLTPVRSLWFPLVVGALLLGVAWFETLTWPPHDAVGGLPYDGGGVGAAALGVVGSAAARRDQRWLAASSGLVFALVLYHTLSTASGPLATVAGVVGVGLPVLALGYALTPAGGEVTAA